MMRFVSVPSSRDLIVEWAEVMVTAHSVGQRIEVADVWIAATALLYDAPLVTNNPDDCAGVAGIKILANELSFTTGAHPDPAKSCSRSTGVRAKPRVSAAGDHGR